MCRKLRLGLYLLLPLLSMLGACADTFDAPPDPALRDVRISYVHATPEWIMERGYAMHLARSARDQTLAFSSLTRRTRTCVVTLPWEDMVGADLYRRLKAHEERHCYGETHAGTTFRGEPPFE